MDMLSDLLENNTDHTKHMDGAFEDVQDGQWPNVVTVCCSDSRVLQDHMMLNETPGHIFTAGNIGNRVIQHTSDGRAVSGDVLYPVEHAGTDTIIVIGHTSCGAVTATYRDLTEGIDEPSGIQHCISVLADRLREGLEELPEDLDEGDAINHLVEYNVDQQVAFLLDSEEIDDDVDIVGLVYDFQDVYSEERGRLHIININGTTDPRTLRQEHPDHADRIDRLWDR